MIYPSKALCCLTISTWCYTRRFTTTIFSATQRCNIVSNRYNIVPILQRCDALKNRRCKSSPVTDCDLYSMPKYRMQLKSNIRAEIILNAFEPASFWSKIMMTTFLKLQNCLLVYIIFIRKCLLVKIHVGKSQRKIYKPQMPLSQVSVARHEARLILFSVILSLHL